MKEEIYQFLITLTGSAPLIWRRLQVYSDITFDEFHRVIQTVMGWQNSHLYGFKFKKYSILMPNTETLPWDKSIQMYGEEICLGDMLKRAGQKFRYLYDFGDNWKHEILFEKRLPVDDNQTYPVCTGGEGACPPENCGGIWGFYDKLEIAHGRKKDVDKESADNIKQYLGDFDPTYFDIDEVNNKLKLSPGSQVEIDEDFDFEEIIGQYLDSVDTTFRLADCFEELGLQKTGKIKKEIHELIETSGEVVVDKDRFYPKVSFLKDFAIRIMPTDFEIENGILIPGHRLLPFLPGNVLSDEVEFIYNNKLLEAKDVFLSVDQLDTYFGLLDYDELPIIAPGPRLNGAHWVSLIAFDLAGFYKKNHFEPGDSIILKMEDFAGSIFSIRGDSVTSLNRHKKEIKAWDNLFIATLKKVLRENIEKNYLEEQLMYTYYYMSRSLTPEQKRIPGTEVGVLLRRTKEISYSEIEDSGLIFHFGSKVVVNVSHMDS